MKKGLLSLLTCFSILFASQAKAKEYFKPLTAEPSAVYDSIWIDYDVKENDVLGMKIHLSFTTYNMKGMDAFIAIYYSYNDEIAGVLKDNNDKYVSPTFSKNCNRSLISFNTSLAMAFCLLSSISSIPSNHAARLSRFILPSSAIFRPFILK